MIHLPEPNAYRYATPTADGEPVWATKQAHESGILNIVALYTAEQMLQAMQWERDRCAEICNAMAELTANALSSGRTTDDKLRLNGATQALKRAELEIRQAPSFGVVQKASGSEFICARCGLRQSFKHEHGSEPPF